MISESLVGKNEKYKQQLSDHLYCGDEFNEKLRLLVYKERDLIDFFTAIHQCKNLAFIGFDIKKKRDFFNLFLNLGVFKTDQRFVFDSDELIELSSVSNYRFGLTAEFILPFNMGAWSILVEGNYLEFTNTRVSSSGKEFKIDYKTYDLGFGLRRYLNLGDKLKIYGNANYFVNFCQTSTIDLGSGFANEILPTSRKGIGFGFIFNKRISGETRYEVTKIIDSANINPNVRIRYLSIILGINLF